jgi:hypothetical protein
MVKAYTKSKIPKSWSKEKTREYFRIIDSFKVFDVPEEQQQWVLEALHDHKHWDWFKDCNGANIVSEPGWKGKYHPAYVYHDYAWSKWGPTWKSNNRMKYLQDTYGMDGWRSNLRWVGVTFFGMPVHATIRWFKSWF